MIVTGTEEPYDVVIIGAGLSGLVCGCYLAKAGIKVLIAEQHKKPGGYCTSFRRKGFTFDAAAHSFGSYRPGGMFHTVLSELGIDKMINIRRYDPSDVVLTPDHKITFWADHNKTIQELLKVFPHEDKISDFFSFLANPKPSDIAALRNMTFQDLLDRYFIDERIRAILSFQIFGNGGLPPSLMTAFTGSKIFTEFVIDGGYYPEEGMQMLPDILVKRFRTFGGNIRLSSPVVKIIVDHRATKGVILKSGEVIYARNVVSNCDARQTFIDLLGEDIVGKDVMNKLNSMTPSLSMFIAYLGIDGYFDALPRPGSTLWFLPHYDLEQLYESAKNISRTDLTKYLFRVSPDGKSILAMTNSSFKTKEYWDSNKARLLEEFIKIIERSAIPGLSKHIVYKEAATPYTLFRYTANYQGAAYGWESLQNQFLDPDFRKPQFTRGLYLTGHWTTYAQGLAGVVYLGYDLAKSLINKEPK